MTVRRGMLIWKLSGACEASSVDFLARLGISTMRTRTRLYKSASAPYRAILCLQKASGASHAEIFPPGSIIAHPITSIGLTSSGDWFHYFPSSAAIAASHSVSDLVETPLASFDLPPSCLAASRSDVAFGSAGFSGSL